MIEVPVIGGSEWISRTVGALDKDLLEADLPLNFHTITLYQFTWELPGKQRLVLKVN